MPGASSGEVAAVLRGALLAARSDAAAGRLLAARLGSNSLLLGFEDASAAAEGGAGGAPATNNNVHVTGTGAIRPRGWRGAIRQLRFPVFLPVCATCGFRCGGGGVDRSAPESSNAGSCAVTESLVAQATAWLPQKRIRPVNALCLLAYVLGRFCAARHLSSQRQP
jgi:hypothetical protein